MEANKKQRHHSILGLAFDGGRLDAVVLKRTNGSAKITASCSAALALNPLTDDPELAGREIRNHLEAAEIRERRCVVCLPLNWMLSLQTAVPPMPEEDIASFLEIEAEKGFPYGPEALLTASSLARLPGGERLATQLAAQREHLARLEQVLRAARLIPESFSPGLPAQQDGSGVEAVTLALSIGEHSAGLQAAAGKGLLVLRALDNAIETEGGETRINPDTVARELRIALGQLPPSIRAGAGTLRVFGTGAQAAQMVPGLRSRIDSLGLKIEQATRFTPEEIGLKLPEDAGVSPVVALAARRLAGRESMLEFLPPRVSAWRRFTTKYSSRKLAYGGMAAGLVALLLMAAFLYQQVQLIQLRSEWGGMSVRVRELEGIQKQIRQYRPWFDETFRTLSILKKLTEAFPEEGTVTAKSILIGDTAPVTCAGTAGDQKELMKMIDRLSAMSGINEVRMGPMSGEAPLQFTFNFQCSEGARP